MKIKRRILFLLLMFCFLVVTHVKAQYTGQCGASSPVQWCGYHKGALIGISDIIATHSPRAEVTFSISCSIVPDCVLKVVITNSMPGWQRCELGTMYIFPQDLSGNFYSKAFVMSYSLSGANSIYCNGTAPFAFEVWDGSTNLAQVAFYQ